VQSEEMNAERERERERDILFPVWKTGRRQILLQAVVVSSIGG
jgi:hypothetical protein